MSESTQQSRMIEIKPEMENTILDCILHLPPNFEALQPALSNQTLAKILLQNGIQYLPRLGENVFDITTEEGTYEVAIVEECLHVTRFNKERGHEETMVIEPSQEQTVFEQLLEIL